MGSGPITVVYGKPAPAPGMTGLDGYVCSTCGLPLVVPVFHPGQANITDHKPTVDLTPASSRFLDLDAPTDRRRLEDALCNCAGPFPTGHSHEPFCEANGINHIIEALRRGPVERVNR